MSTKRRLLYSALIGLVLVLLSLFYKTGANNLEPMPYINGGCGNGGVCGVVITPPGGFKAPTSLAKRGLLLPIVSIRADKDTPNNYYKSLIVGNLVFDYLFFTLVSFGFMSMLATYKKY